MLNNFIDRIKLSFRKDKELYLSLYEILGFYPHDISYYKMALLHKSIMHRNSKGKPVNNERLEFLGDAVLDALVQQRHLVVADVMRIKTEDFI
jgi:ribonuclease-3